MNIYIYIPLLNAGIYLFIVGKSPNTYRKDRGQGTKSQIIFLSKINYFKIVLL